MTMSPNVDVVPKDAYLQSERPGPLDRAVSDLFDAQEDYENKITKKGSASTEEETTLSSTYSGSDSSLSLPTLPRYPVAETRNTNCWSEPPVSIFSVRGSNYFADKKKITSAQYLFEARGSDILLSDAAETVDFSRM